MFKHATVYCDPTIWEWGSSSTQRINQKPCDVICIWCLYIMFIPWGILLVLVYKCDAIITDWIWHREWIFDNLQNKNVIFQVFIQLVVLVAAVMFIFFHMPLIICLSSVPLVVIFIYVSVYGAYFTKALELSNVCVFFFFFIFFSILNCSSFHSQRIQ